MALTTLRCRLTSVSTSRVQVLEQKVGATEMPRGRAWMKRRQEIALAHGYRCFECRRVWLSDKDQIDHLIPREQGGSNDDSNLRPLCNECHQAKTKREAATRAGTRLP